MGGIILGVAAFLLLVAAANGAGKWVAENILRTGRVFGAPKPEEVDTCAEARDQLEGIEESIEATESRLESSREDLGFWSWWSVWLIVVIAFGLLAGVGMLAGAIIPGAIAAFVAAGLATVALVFVQTLMAEIRADISALKEKLETLERQKTEAEAAVERLCVARAVPETGTPLAGEG